MPTEVLTPNSTESADSNLTGDHTAVDDDPDSPGGDWRTASSNNSTSTAAHGFGTPTGSPNTGSGLQNFKIYARLTANATSCTYNVYLSESGTRLNGGSSIATGSLTSASGQLITASWDATLLGTADGSLVECEFVVTKSGGSPGNRTTGEVDAIEWNVDYSAGAVTSFMTISVSPAAVSSLVISKTLVKSLITTSIVLLTLTKRTTFTKSLLVGVSGSSVVQKGIGITLGFTASAVPALSRGLYKIIPVLSTASVATTNGLIVLIGLAVSPTPVAVATFNKIVPVVTSSLQHAKRSMVGALGRVGRR